MKVMNNFIKDIREKTREYWGMLDNYLSDDHNKSLTRYIVMAFVGMLVIIGLMIMFSGPVWSVVLGCLVNPWFLLTLLVTIPLDFGLGMWLHDKLPD